MLASNSVNAMSASIRNSDAIAFTKFFEQTQDTLFNYLYCKVRNSEAAQDLVQEVYTRLWERRNHVKDNLSLRSYVFTIAHNLASNWHRHNYVVNQFENDSRCSVTTNESPLDEYEFRETQSILIDALAGLPHHQRMIFIMSRFQGLTYAQIAERLDISVKTVESHMVKALRLLRESLEASA